MMAAQDEQHLYSLPLEQVPMASNNYNDLVNKPQINGVPLTGNKSSSDLGINIPTKTSDLTNDSGFITASDLPTKTSDLTNDSDFTTKTYVDEEIAKLTVIDGATFITQFLATASFNSTFDNLATTLQTQLASIKSALTSDEFVEIKALKIATIGNVKPSSTIKIDPTTDLLSLVIDWQGVSYNNNVIQAIDIVNKKVVTLTMTNDLNNDAFVSYFEDATQYSFVLEYNKYKTIDLT